MGGRQNLSTDGTCVPQHAMGRFVWALSDGARSQGSQHLKALATYIRLFTLYY